ncbi:MAG: glycosyl transferase [Meiothermus sp.]|uniref:glycosyltransferase n=1 Tax=Meiothermus sp. TaxID=1955249 RepID=UPI0025DAD94D|nr:glycosyltransferase [Meiothermus sp.]MCS7058371.1 glycosyl transferase [Meiothermus sp.]MCS7194377.1 glycosyl transferase [Meiothermus sp.]MCX7739865.1 glycosyl transferase [Meiothermus sp.]MDW8089858.1 glycosyltransferase [Meiothermus sp.]MDW8481716.1 glycosyltransferase [Meiothermus sp.]
MPQRILLVYTKAGGGHYAMAQTLYKLLKELEPEAEVRLFNFFDVGPRWIAQAIQDGYNFAVNKQRWLFTVFQAFYQTRPAIQTFARVLGMRLAPAINEYLEAFQPDKIIYCYPVNHGFRRLPYVRRRNPKTLTVVTDIFSPHLYWFVDPKDQYVVASPEAYSIARRHRVPPENLHYFQTLIDPRFNQPLPQSEAERLRREWGLEEAYTVLVTGGGAGLKISFRLVQELIRIPGINVVVVCGYNQRLYRQLLGLKERQGLKNLVLFGFTHQMYELINLADVVVSKAGPATIAEVLSLRKDLIVCDYVWPQEHGNVELIRHERLGYYIRHPKRIAAKIVELKSRPPERRGLELKNEIVRLAEYILKL